jgi:endonuclease YncB( thermonuclease family)
MRAALALCCIGLATPALGEAVVIDGSTLTVDGKTYRLWGIDVPAHRQPCTDGSSAGVMAVDVLRNLVQGKTIECEAKAQATDRYGRTIAVCRADGLDLGSMMVRAGWAWAANRDYVRQETEAWVANAGVHSHDCAPRWNWRPP